MMMTNRSAHMPAFTSSEILDTEDPYQWAPGPDYKLYLSPEFVETEADFERLKPGMVRVGDVKTFKNFLVPVPESIDPARERNWIVLRWLTSSWNTDAQLLYDRLARRTEFATFDLGATVLEWTLEMGETCVPQS